MNHDSTYFGYTLQPQLLLSLHINKFIIAAKLTQSMYGISRTPATFDTFMKFRIVNNMSIQRIEISINPARGDLSPKNAADQSTLKTSWTAKMRRPFLTC